MSEKTKGIHSLLSGTFFYSLSQKIMSGPSFRKKIVKGIIKKNNVKILDVGCGTATHARILPTINHGNPQSGSRAAKEAMVRGQVIKSAFCSHPIFNSSIRRAEN